MPVPAHQRCGRCWRSSWPRPPTWPASRSSSTSPTPRAWAPTACTTSSPKRNACGHENGDPMSTADFQLALADLIASPQACVAARRNPDSAFANRRLDDRERARLIAMVNHEGMSTNCTMYRAYRTGAVVRALPRTTEALGADLGRLLDGFWAHQPGAKFQTPVEARAFACWLAAVIGPNPAVAHTLAEDLA